MNEQWKPISVPGFERLYSVSTHGRVRGEQRLVGRGAGIWDRPPRILRTHSQKSGHIKIVLRSADTIVTVRVHRLVLEAFGGPCPEGMECCHNDGNPANNHIANLRWDTKAANARDSAHHGTRARGQKHGRSKLTETQVRAIKERLRTGARQATIAADYGVTYGTVSKIALGTTWSHI